MMGAQGVVDRSSKVGKRVKQRAIKVENDGVVHESLVWIVKFTPPLRAEAGKSGM